MVVSGWLGACNQHHSDHHHLFRNRQVCQHYTVIAWVHGSVSLIYILTSSTSHSNFHPLPSPYVCTNKSNAWTLEWRLPALVPFVRFIASRPQIIGRIQSGERWSDRSQVKEWVQKGTSGAASRDMARPTLHTHLGWPLSEILSRRWTNLITK